MPVVREREHHVGAGVDELLVQSANQLGVFEHDLRDERPSLQISAPLELEQIALGAHDWSLVELRQQTWSRAVIAHLNAPENRIANP